MEIFLIVTAVVAAVMLLLGLIDPQQIYVASDSPTRGRVMAIYGSVTLALAFTYLATNPDLINALRPDPFSRAQSALNELSPQVADAKFLVYTDGEHELHFAYTHPSEDRTGQGHENIIAQSMDLIKRAGVILTEKEISVKSIVLKVKAAKDDKFGNPGAQEVFTATVPPDIITKINWKNIKPVGLMDLVAVTFTKEGLSMMRDACPATPSPSYFCIQFRRQFHGWH